MIPLYACRLRRVWGFTSGSDRSAPKNPTRTRHAHAQVITGMESFQARGVPACVPDKVCRLGQCAEFFWFFGYIFGRHCALCASARTNTFRRLVVNGWQKRGGGSHAIIAPAAGCRTTYVILRTSVRIVKISLRMQEERKMPTPSEAEGFYG